MNVIDRRNDTERFMEMNKLLNTDKGTSNVKKPKLNRHKKVVDDGLDLDELIAQSNNDITSKRMKKECKGNFNRIISPMVPEPMDCDESNSSVDLKIRLNDKACDASIFQSKYIKTLLPLRASRSFIRFVKDDNLIPKVKESRINIDRFCSSRLINSTTGFILQAKQSKVNFHELLKVRKDGSSIKILKPRDHYEDFLMKQVNMISIGYKKRKPTKKQNMIERNSIITKIKKSYIKYTKQSKVTIIPKVCVIGSYKCGKSSIVGQVLEKMGDTNENFIKSTKWSASKMQCQQLEKAWISDISNDDRFYKETIYPYYTTISNADNKQIYLIDCPGNKCYLDSMIHEMVRSDKIVWVVNLKNDWLHKTKSFKNESSMINTLKIIKIFKINSCQIKFLIINPDKQFNTEYVLMDLKNMIQKYLKEKTLCSIEIVSEFIYNLSNEDKECITNMLWENNATIDEKIVNDSECICVVKDVVKPIESKSSVLICEVKSGAIISNESYDVFVPGSTSDKPIKLTVKQMKCTVGNSNHKQNRNEAFAGEIIEFTNMIIGDNSGNFICKEESIKVGSIITNHFVNSQNANRDEISQVIMRTGHKWKASLLLLEKLSDCSPLAPGVLYKFLLSSSSRSYVCRIDKIIDVSCQKRDGKPSRDKSSIRLCVTNRAGIQVTVNLAILGASNDYERLPIQLNSVFKLDVFFLTELNNTNRIVCVGKIIEALPINDNI